MKYQTALTNLVLALSLIFSLAFACNPAEEEGAKPSTETILRECTEGLRNLAGRNNDLIIKEAKLIAYGTPLRRNGGDIYPVKVQFTEALPGAGSSFVSQYTCELFKDPAGEWRFNFLKDRQ
jgi:hypothetical protein